VHADAPRRGAQTLLAADADDMAQLLGALPDGGALAELPPYDVARRMAALAAALPPGVDASAMVVEEPCLLLHTDAAHRVCAALRALRASCPRVDVDAVAAAQPAAMAALLAELDEAGGALGASRPCCATGSWAAWACDDMVAQAPPGAAHFVVDASSVHWRQRAASVCALRSASSRSAIHGSSSQSSTASVSRCSTCHTRSVAHSFLRTSAARNDASVAGEKGPCTPRLGACCRATPHPRRQ
jgi:hypothetical protein